MRLLYWFLVVTLALDILGRLLRLAEQDFAPRTPTGELGHTVVNIVLLLWILLAWR